MMEPPEFVLEFSGLCSEGTQARLDVLHEPPRDPAPPTLRVHRQPVQVTTPTVPAADQARDQALAIPGEDEQVPIAPEPSSERIRTIVDARLGGGAPPQLDHLLHVRGSAGPYRDPAPSSAPLRASHRSRLAAPTRTPQPFLPRR